MQQHFEILELDHTATKEDVQTAFRRLARYWHPDVNKSPNAPEMYRSICEARDHLLAYLEAKQSYDIPLDTESDAGSSSAKSTAPEPEPSHQKNEKPQPRHNGEATQAQQQAERSQANHQPHSSEPQQNKPSGQTQSRVPPPPTKIGSLARFWNAITHKFYAIPWSFVFCFMLAAIILCRILGLL